MYVTIIALAIVTLVLLCYLYFDNPVVESFKEEIEEDGEGWITTYKDRSPWQTIELLEKDDKFIFMLNDQIQVYSEEYKTSHAIQCSIPVKKFRPKKILILGGGDLIAASCCLKYDFVESVTVVEIDGKVVEMVKKNKLMKKITKSAYEDKRLNIVVGDALSYIEKCEDNFDMIIEDIEIDFTKQETNMERSVFIQNCLRVAPIYVGSIPDYNIKNKSQVVEIANKRKKKYYTMNGRKTELLEELNFSNSDIQNIEALLSKCDLSVAAYDYGKVYGCEGYLMIKKN